MRTGDEGKARQKLGNVHDDAPSQVSAHVGAVAHCSGEAEGRANDQRPCWDVRHVPVGRRVHQADSEQPGGLGMEIRGLRIAGLPMWVATQGEGFTADSFRYKKGDREDPSVCWIFSVALKRKGTLGMSPFLPSSRKNDSL